MRTGLLAALAALAISLALPAGATSLLGDSHDVNQTNVNAPTQVNTQTNLQTTVVGQDQHQTQVQGQAQDNDQQNIGLQSTSVNYSYSNKQVRQAPDLGVLPSGPCTGGSGQGTLGAAGFAFGIGIADVDETCSKLEVVRIGLASDDPQIRDLAKRVYLSIDFVRDVNPEDGTTAEQRSARPAAEQTAEVYPPVYYGSNR